MQTSVLGGHDTKEPHFVAMVLLNSSEGIGHGESCADGTPPNRR